MKDGPLEQHIVTYVGILDAQVCSAGTYDEALAFIRRTHPAGTEHNWQKNEDGPFAPLACERYPDRKHFMFVC